MNVKVAYGRRKLELDVPDDAVLYSPAFPPASAPSAKLVLDAVRRPVAGPKLVDAVRTRQPGSVVVVVSDITRPVPYHSFLKELLSEIEAGGVAQDAVTVLIATGMHRPSTESERKDMFGEEICGRYKILDHRAAEKEDLVMIPGRSWSGRPIELNRHFVQAEFRVTTGLVEPHFMAGFSGGRKSVCPGLSSLDTIKAFHGYEFLADQSARNANLDGNPLHEEALSIARVARVDFCVNVIVNGEREVIATFAGELEASHVAACEFVGQHACPRMEGECDVVLTSCGGYPLDATFYQCVKGMVTCLPTVKRGGAVLAVGRCSEGIGSPEYRALMYEYTGRHKVFLHDLRERKDVRKDQWELQMQIRVMDHVGEWNLHFVADGLPDGDLTHLSAQGIDVRGKDVEREVQQLLDTLLSDGRSLAVMPEGPYCAPVSSAAAR